MLRKRIKGISFITVSGIALLLLLSWRWSASRYESTDNAYVQGDITAIAPKVAGYVTSIAIEDNSPVKAGDELFRIDQTDFAAEVAQAEASVTSGRAALENITASTALQHAQILKAESQLDSAKAAQQRAHKEFLRQTRLHKNEATTEQVFEDALTAKELADSSVVGALANLEVERRRLDVLAAQYLEAEAALLQAEARLDIAKNNLEHTVVRAPVAGIIGNRRVRVGRYVTPGTPLADIVPVNDVWITANFKEVQLENIAAGQPVAIKIDAYPDNVLTGIVDGIAPGSGLAFSMLPPDNATGNFIRIVQRVPVKIRIANNPLTGKLVPGLSAKVRIEIATSQK